MKWGLIAVDFAFVSSLFLRCTHIEMEVVDSGKYHSVEGMNMGIHCLAPPQRLELSEQCHWSLLVVLNHSPASTSLSRLLFSPSHSSMSSINKYPLSKWEGPAPVLKKLLIELDVGHHRLLHVAVMSNQDNLGLLKLNYILWVL